MPGPQPPSISARRIIELLDLKPLPGEGGHFRETFRASGEIPSGALDHRYHERGVPRPRSHSTQIYFLLTPESPSLMHIVQSDEVFHHYLGDTVEQLHIRPDGSHRIVRIGPDLESGDRPQVVVPHGVWQGCRIAPGDVNSGWSLLGCTVAPGFDWADFRLGTRDDLLALCPGAGDLILALTPAGSA